MCCTKDWDWQLKVKNNGQARLLLGSFIRTLLAEVSFWQVFKRVRSRSRL